MTPYEALCAHQGFQKRELNEWHRARFITHRILLGLGAKCDIEDVLRLEGDAEPLSPDEKKTILARIPKTITRVAKRNLVSKDSELVAP